MIKFIAPLAFAAAAIASPATAKSEAQSFAYDGVTYTYTMEKAGKATVIQGRASSGNAFRFVVHGKRVTGTFDNQAVRFSVSDALENTEGMVVLASAS